MNRRSFLAGVAIFALGFTAAEADAGQASKTIARRAWRRLLARDAARDAATKAKPLAKPERVWRYTTKKDAAEAARHGLAPGKHMTPATSPGRLPNPASAQQRYGLPREPEVRMTIDLPKGQPIRRNSVLGGAPGAGEITSPKPIPPRSIRSITPLPE